MTDTPTARLAALLTETLALAEKLGAGHVKRVIDEPTGITSADINALVPLRAQIEAALSTAVPDAGGEAPHLTPPARLDIRIGLARMRAEHMAKYYTDINKEPPLIDVQALTDSMRDLLEMLGETNVQVNRAVDARRAPPPDAPTREPSEAALKAAREAWIGVPMLPTDIWRAKGFDELLRAAGTASRRSMRGYACRCGRCAPHGTQLFQYPRLGPPPKGRGHDGV